MPIDGAAARGAALAYREMGLGPVPLGRASKRPVRPLKPLLSRRATRREIDSWGWPGVGIVTGAVSGVVVLDADGPEGLATLERLGHPPTPMVRTGGGGMHVYLAYPAERRVGCRGRIAPGVDVRGDGGYAVAPPSVHPDTGNPYEWIVGFSEASPAEPPDWFWEQYHSRPGKVVARDLGSPVPEGRRNATLTSLAGALRARGMDRAKMLRMLEHANKNCCDPPLPVAEVEGIARSVARYEAGNPHSPNGTGPPPGDLGVLLSEVEPERTGWLWRGWIPLGKLCLLEGDPGEGKSAFTMDVAARVSRGIRFPGGRRSAPAGVVVLSAEDGLADTVRPRLDAAGADPARVKALTTVPAEEGGERLFSVPRDVPLLERVARGMGARLVVVDPLVAFLAGDAHKDQDVRRALAPLAIMAERTGAAVLVVRHLNKGTNGNALYRGAGSIGIVGAARSGMLIGRDPADDSRRVLAAQKNNLSGRPVSLAFGLEEAPNGAVRVVWRGRSQLTAGELLDAPNQETRNAQAEAQDFLGQVLGTGPVSADDVMEEARRAGISKATLRRAKAAMRVESKREGQTGKQGGGRWTWALPKTPSV